MKKKSKIECLADEETYDETSILAMKQDFYVCSLLYLITLIKDMSFKCFVMECGSISIIMLKLLYLCCYIGILNL